MTPDPNPRKRSSTAAKLVQAAALAALLVPLGSVAIEAGPITCGYNGASGFGGSGSTGCSNSTGASDTFTWFDGGTEIYRFELAFQGLDPFTSFSVTIDDVAMDLTEFNTRAALFPGYVPIPLVDPDGPLATAGPYRDFQVFAPGPGLWDSYTFFIHWTYDSHTTGYAATDDTIGVLHDIGNPLNENYLPNGNLYDEDMCIEFDNCDYDEDPGNRGGDTDFASVTNTIAPVPEPSSLILLATGVSGILYRRCRRRQQSEAPPQA